MNNIQKFSDRELFSELFDNPINPLFLNMVPPFVGENSPMFHLQINGTATDDAWEDTTDASANESAKTRETLVHRLITTHILPGTVIYSDQFSPYIPLNQLGYNQLAVNHSLTCERSCIWQPSFKFTDNIHEKITRF